MNASEITFGIEIECVIPTDAWNGRPIGGYHRGLSIADAPKFVDSDGVEHSWKAERDCSINTTLRNHTCVEIVSPVLKGESGLRNVLAILEWLNAMGAKVNRSCGLHVTTGFPVYDIKAMKRLIHFVARHEDGIYASTGTKFRENGQYSRKSKPQLEGLKNVNSIAKIHSDRGARSRYGCLNLTHAISGRERIEFRAFAGTLNPVKMLGYINMVLAIIEQVTNSKATQPWDCKPQTAKTRGHGEGYAKLYTLMQTLKWINVNTDVRPLGLVAKSELKESRTKLFELADKYDS